ncbi:MAG TPA: L,D-transpeptidase family protein, partial [Thermomicrobiales bacterium]|nr:L,D-transpeptidase family protein [Thermomicrobiales bacterium]
LAPISAAADTATEVATVPANDGTPVVPADTATPEPTATVAEPTATESATIDPTATETAIAEPSETATETSTSVASEPTSTSTDVPSATEVPATEPPTATKTAKPTKTATVSDEGLFNAAVVSDLQITVSCTGSAETIRVKNIGVGTIQIQGISTFVDPIAGEPFAISRNLKAGQTAIYQAGRDAKYGTVLTSHYIFTNSAYDSEGVRVATSVGEAVQMCAPRPAPPVGKLSDLKITLDCLSTAETIRVANNGSGWIRLKGIATYINPIADEPFAVSRVLKPGQTAIFQSGSGAKYGTILTKEFIFTNAEYEKDGVRVNTDVGKAYQACPKKPVPPEHWIEVNLSTQYLTAWEGNTKVNGTWVSTGKNGFETPTGTYYIWLRYRYQTMSGCIQGECYNVPDVPWVQYFTHYGHALHGTYWHNDFGIARRSHGCVNLPLWFAAWLWDWATYGTRVWIHY